VLTQARAIENGVSMVEVMGVPAGGEIWDRIDPGLIVNNDGRVRAEGTRCGEGIFIGEVSMDDPPIPYNPEGLTQMRSWKQVKFSQRRPDSYGILTDENPPVYNGWDMNLR
jgi:predicted amidohydrolase